MPATPRKIISLFTLVVPTKTGSSRSDAHPRFYPQHLPDVSARRASSSPQLAVTLDTWTPRRSLISPVTAPETPSEVNGEYSEKAEHIKPKNVLNTTFYVEMHTQALFLLFHYIPPLSEFSRSLAREVFRHLTGRFTAKR